MTQRLTATAVKNAKPREAAWKLADGGGLYLLVQPNGARYWRYKYRLEGKEQVFSIGAYPEITLADARTSHTAARKLVAQNVSPTRARKTAELQKILDASNTFEQVARRWMAEHRSSWSPAYFQQVRVGMEREVFPFVGNVSLEKVTVVELRQVILRVATRTLPPDGRKERDRGATTVATLLRLWCSAIYRYGMAHGYVQGDPTSALKGLIKRPKVRHHQHLVVSEISPFIERLQEGKGTRQVQLAVELLLLTFVRTGELRHAEWDEIDLGQSLWRIPAAKMKMRRPHLVPLSVQAIAKLHELNALTGSQRFLFPNQRRPSEVMTATTVNRYLERLGYGGKLSGHGFRGTASTLLNERGFRSAVIEKQLAHDSRGIVEASYNHAEYLEERRKMMQAWADAVSNFGLN